MKKIILVVMSICLMLFIILIVFNVYVVLIEKFVFFLVLNY